MYTHLLIPVNRDFTPTAVQVANFLQQMESLGALPKKPALVLTKDLGNVIVGRNPQTGESFTVSKRDRFPIGNLADVFQELTKLEDYEVILTGEGPAALPPFEIWAISVDGFNPHTKPYAYEIKCSLRKAPISMTDYPGIGTPCSSAENLAIFHNRITGANIRVRDAACARFWVEFNLGSWLFPNITDSLAILPPSIVDVAQSCFSIAFAQGCFCMA
jgi:hypothetical protein